MINNNLNNNILSGNTYTGANQTSGSRVKKTSENKYYNVLTKKLEEMILPQIDLEHNTPLNPEISTFSRNG